MKLEEGSIVLINLQCGCGEKRVQVIQGSQEIKCPECGRKTYVKFYKKSDRSYEMQVW